MSSDALNRFLDSQWIYLRAAVGESRRKNIETFVEMGGDPKLVLDHLVCAEAHFDEIARMLDGPPVPRESWLRSDRVFGACLLPTLQAERAAGVDVGDERAGGHVDFGGFD